ncbi:MAG: methylenetetrahydrofolate reductase [NAD(P)H] [Nitrospiraceae bacterium]|nr:MAG: methylenetetrahydrofolate reductase [NAD(P)H] [Nitrospiraceae bacterium]
MNRKITDIFREKEKTFSLEFFPPKTPKGVEQLYRTADELNKLGPDFVSVTYGAGGSTRGATMEICAEIQKRFDIAVMHHLTCVGHSRSELKAILDQAKANNIRNILSLRGDPPKGVEIWEPAPDGFEYCYQLNDFIRDNYGDFFSVGVAGFPEGHIHCPDKATDTKHLKIKIEHGGEFIITQLFFDNTVYSEYLERLKNEGVQVRVIPGILPITSYEGLLKFCNTCGATVTQEVHDIFKLLSGDEQATAEAGIDFAVRQCKDLLDRGAPGLHFFTLNKTEPVREIWKRLGIK